MDGPSHEWDVAKRFASIAEEYGPSVDAVSLRQLSRSVERVVGGA